jgi:uncharacterized protein YbjT (DUF2867 family)
MRILLFGATGMVGQGVLRECLRDPAVQQVQTIGRTATGVIHPKLREIVHRDMFQYSGISAELTGFDACFFCLGVSSGGMAPDTYERLTYTLTVAVAEALSALNPGMTFVYVSGAGTDSTEQGRLRWARVKGKTENALLRMPFRAAYMFRPGLIVPLHGIRSKTALYRVFYSIGRPLLPVLKAVFPNQVLTTEQVGRAMVNAVRFGASKQVLESGDIRELADKG